MKRSPLAILEARKLSKREICCASEIGTPPTTGMLPKGSRARWGGGGTHP